MDRIYFAVDGVKKVWKNCCDTFRQKAKSGSAGDAGGRWVHHRAMQFMVPHQEHRGEYKNMHLTLSSDSLYMDRM